MDIALKATYNDGNKGNYIGFKGVCSAEILINNIKAGRVNCSSSDNPCRKYFDNRLKVHKPKINSQCYESQLFNDWKFGAGMYHNGDKAGKAIPIRRASEGDLAIVTTRFPDTEEKDRKIVGIYKIAKVDEETKDTMGTLLVADEKGRLELPADIAAELNFWDYYNPTSIDKQWHEGLFRYMEKEKTDSILLSLDKLLVDEKQRLALKELRDPSKLKPTPTAGGLDPTIKKVLLNRKYGSGGEGKEHRELKEWIAQNPSFLGLADVIKTEVEEHRFPSNDLPDIVFQLKSGWAAVEIETTNPLPGAYQAVKYRALLRVEQGLDLEDPSVTCFLVAYEIPTLVGDFCKRYKVGTKAKKI